MTWLLCQLYCRGRTDDTWNPTVFQPEQQWPDKIGILTNVMPLPHFRWLVFPADVRPPQRVLEIIEAAMAAIPVHLSQPGRDSRAEETELSNRGKKDIISSPIERHSCPSSLSFSYRHRLPRLFLPCLCRNRRFGFHQRQTRWRRLWHIQEPCHG